MPVQIKQRAQRLAERAAQRVRDQAPTPAPGSTATTESLDPRPAVTVKPPAPRTAILVVDGFDRRGRWGAFNEEEAREFPWVDLCLTQVERHSRSSDYEVLVWDNTWMPEHRRLIESHDRVR